jgi:NAD(P)-dependent dehydrogenase (short-subunit alcohol dehydrogenase family)
MPGRVEGTVAPSTGAARGKARADAARLAQEGACVIAIVERTPSPGVAPDSVTEF